MENTLKSKIQENEFNNDDIFENKIVIKEEFLKYGYVKTESGELVKLTDYLKILFINSMTKEITEIVIDSQNRFLNRLDSMYKLKRKN